MNARVVNTHAILKLTVQTAQEVIPVPATAVIPEMADHAQVI